MQLMLGLLNIKRPYGGLPERSQKHPLILHIQKANLKLLTRFELNPSLSPINEFPRVEASLSLKVIITVVPVLFVGADHEEIRNRGVVGDLLAVELGAVGVVAL
jgi:hypothetical protein